MQCPNCKHWNEAGSRFCEECGFELVADPQNQPVSAQVSVRAADENETDRQWATSITRAPPHATHDEYIYAGGR